MSGSISTGVPPSLLVPGYYVNVAPAGSTASPSYRVLIIGESTDTAALGIPVLATDTGTVAATHGATSGLSQTYATYRAVDPVTEVWLLPIAVAGAATIAASLTALKDLSVNLFAIPYDDAVTIAAVDAYLTARWSYTQQNYGMAVTVATGTATDLEAVGTAFDSKYVSILGVPSGSTSTVPQMIGAYAAAVAVSASADPALPLQQIALNIAAPPYVNSFAISDRQALLTAGIATCTVSPYGAVTLERAVTTYKTNSAGVADNSYQDSETLNTLAYVLNTIKTQVVSLFFASPNQKKLVADGTDINRGSNLTTSQVILSAAIAIYRSLCDSGICQNYSTFAQNATAVNAGNGKVSMSLPIDLANQLRAIDVILTFSKS